MVELIHQKTPNDCVVAAIAMATGKPYDLVLEVALEGGHYKPGEGTRNVQDILKSLGYSYEWKDGSPVGDFIAKHKVYGIAPELYRDFLWGRKALVTVPSLNIEGGHHMVFYDGYTVYDPNPMEKKRYTEFKELLPSEVVIFRHDK